MKIRVGKNMYWNPLILLRNIFALIFILIIIWAIISYGEILCKNVHPNPEYSPYNFWMLYEYL